MTKALTSVERKRFNNAKDRVIECVNELVDDGYKSHEIYVGLTECAIAVLVEGVPDLEERAAFVRLFVDRTLRMKADA